MLYWYGGCCFFNLFVLLLTLRVLQVVVVISTLVKRTPFLFACLLIDVGCCLLSLLGTFGIIWLLYWLRYDVGLLVLFCLDADCL